MNADFAEKSHNGQFFLPYLKNKDIGAL